MVKYLFIPVFILLPMQGYTKDSVILNKRPLNIQLQYAGNMGLISAGLGKSFAGEKIYLHFIYGFLPKRMNNSEVHTLSLKSSYQFLCIGRQPKLQAALYSGISLLYGITSGTFIKLPEYFPENYYSPNAIYASVFAGSRLMKYVGWGKIKIISLFTEVGTLDYHIWYAIINKHIDFSDIWNISFGVAVSL